MEALIRRHISISIALALLLSVSLFIGSVSAANYDFANNTPMTLTGSSVDLTILAGSEADELTIGNSTLTVVVAAGESFTLQAPDEEELVNDGGYDGCALQGGFPTVTVNGPDTVIFTPAGTCSSGGGGGGGGSGSTTSSTGFTDPDLTLSLVTSGLLFAGDPVVFNWGITGDGVTEIEFRYSQDGGATSQLIASALDPETGRYTWTVPEGVFGSVTVSAHVLDNSGTSLTSDSLTITIGLASTDTCIQAAFSDLRGCEFIDNEGRRAAIGSGVMGVNPFTGEPEEISVVEPGMFIRSASFPTVYLMTANLERKILWDTQTFFTWADSWDEVTWVTDATLATLPLTKPMLPKPERILVKIQSDPRVYATYYDDTAASGIQLREVESEAVAIARYGESWSDFVIDLPPTVFAHYSIGDFTRNGSRVDPDILVSRDELMMMAASE